MQTLVGILIAVAMLITLGVLFSGLIVMARGGETNRKYGNALMRWRVICQGIALALLAVAFMIGNGN
ncbi:twin transmembrane helix small protein [Ferruginivarius sediminum]|uniref:Twin transmembrane helix small protein n=1 Tax=Ferruginivarius sediminum TaxID=2661937 RepID=A0A369TAA7_9PROT|nr:twin transmembrane helix small protein [Ferruginivarius sediminum]RDD62220.1 twin transmembrane helix small protein [Ferruginivarius sediminum]